MDYKELTGTYEWLVGGPMGKATAQEIGEELEAVSKKHNFKTQAGHVVEYAKDKKTSLHRMFEWDDKKAGHEYRLEQARHVIRHIMVNVKLGETPDKQPITISIRKYETIRETETINVYMDTLEVLTDEDLRIQIMRKVRSKIESAADKMRKYNALIGYFTEDRQNVLFDMVEGMKEEESKLVKV